MIVNGKLTWPTVGMVAVIGAVVVALTLVGVEGATILGVVGVLAGIGGGAAVVSGQSNKLAEMHRETSAQTPILEEVARRVNGDLDRRIAAAQEEAAEQGAAKVIAELHRQGVFKNG